MNLKHTLLMTAIAGSALSLSACNDAEQGRAKLSGETVATVNGVQIKKIQLDDYIEFRQKVGQPSVDPLEEVINMELLRQEAVKHNLHKDEAVRAAMARAASDALANALVQQKMEEDVKDEDLKAEYDKQITEYKATASPFEYESSHILVKTEEEAKDIIAKLKKGSDFAKLAKAKSTGPSGPKGGSLGWASSDTFVPPFAEALKTLEKGKFTETPVKTQFGYHVVKLNDKREAKQPELPSFEMVKNQLKKMKQQESMIQFMETLREEAKVEKPSNEEAHEHGDDTHTHDDDTPSNDNISKEEEKAISEELDKAAQEIEKQDAAK